MNQTIGWALAVLAIAVGYAGYGWRGVVLGVTVIVFVLLLQFSRTLRVLRGAAQSPVGHVPSAVMLNSKLQRGLRGEDRQVSTRPLPLGGAEAAGPVQDGCHDIAAERHPGAAGRPVTPADDIGMIGPPGGRRVPDAIKSLVAICGDQQRPVGGVGALQLRGGALRIIHGKNGL